jgi:hypothetical protein
MTQPTTLSSPSGGGDVLKPADVLGHLLLVRPVEFIPEMPTQYGPTDTIRVDVADLSANDGRGQWGAVYRDAMWFGRILVGGLRRQIGEIVLGQMSQGVSKPGQSAPNILVDMMPDPQAVATAQAWLAQHPEFADGRGQASESASAPPAPVIQPHTGPVPVQGVPAPANAAWPPSGVPAPAYAAPPAQVPGPQAYQQSVPVYGPGTTNPYTAGTNTTTYPITSGNVAMPPNVTVTTGGQPTYAPTTNPADPFAGLTEEQKAALAAIGFRPQGG